MMGLFALSFCLLNWPGLEQEQEMTIETRIQLGYFERNDSGLGGPISFLILEDEPGFERIFHPAAVMGQRQQFLKPEDFQTRTVLAVVKRGGMLWNYSPQRMTHNGRTITFRYNAVAEDAGGATFASPLIVSIPKQHFNTVIFVENGKEVGRTTLPETHRSVRTLFDFRNPEAVAPAWQAVNDGVMGGVSEGKFRITDERHLEFSGVLSLENNGGFASIRSRRQTLGLKNDDELWIRMKGDGRVYLLNLYVPTLQMAYAYREKLPSRAGEWTEIRVPLSTPYATSFGRNVPGSGPVDAAKVNSIGLMLSDNQPGPFKLEIEWIKVVPAGEPRPEIEVKSKK